MTSLLIPRINSVLHHLASKPLNIHFQVRKLKVGLRNLKAIFLLFGKLGNAANLNAADRKMLFETVSRTLPLDGKLKELLALLRSFDKDAGNLKKLLEAASTKYYWGEGREQFLKELREAGEDLNMLRAQLGGAIISAGLMIVPEVYNWCVLLDDKWHAKMSNSMARGLTVDDIVGFAGSILENLADFGAMASASQSLHLIEVQGAGEAIDAFEVQVKFLKDFLLFAMMTGVDQSQLQDLLICVHSFTVDASRALIMHRLEGSHANWIQEVQARCLSLSAMAIHPRVYEAYTHALSSSKPSLDMNHDAINMMKSFVDSLISLLWDILRGSDIRKDDQQEVLLYERLRISRTILKQPPQSFDGNKIGGLLRDAGILICSVHQTGADASDPGLLSELLRRFDAFQAEYEIIPEAKKELSVADVTNSMEDVKLLDGNVEDLKVQKEAATTSNLLFKGDELELIVDRLTRGTTNNLQTVLISGMAGIGKTTFALAVYNLVGYHFQAKARCSISQVLDKKKVYLQLLSQTHPKGDYSSIMPEDDLANKLRQSLKQKRYLIFLDDVWTSEPLNLLRDSFPDDSRGSRIILTSRCGDLLPQEQSHSLRLRDDKECLQILKMKLSKTPGWNLDFGMKVAKLCKGLPLTAVIAAGLLATTVEGGWNRILDALTAGSVSIAEQCNSVLELSYKHLPDHLKSCFLYFGAFPEDEKVFARRLTRLWMAEGFVEKDDSKRIEDVAREYLEHLIKRSLVMVAQNRITGGVRTCQIHDLLHDFCRTKANQTGFFHILQGHEQLSDMKKPNSVQRLSIHSELLQFKKSKLFCPQAHSLMFFTSEGQVWSFTCLFDLLFIVQIFKGLKVLDIENILLNSGIPCEIERLTQLRYLSAGTENDVIPSSLGKLSNLETFILENPTGRTEDPISLPQSIWNLNELKYLDIKCSKRGILPMPLKNLEDSSILSKLETVRGVIFRCDGSMESLMEKLPNIRRFKCVIVPTVWGSEDIEKIVVPEILHQLQSLTILARGNQFRLDFGSSKSLTKVTLQEFHLSKEEIAVLGKLPNLEFLKLVSTRFIDGTLEMDEDEFLKLRYLQLGDDFCRSLRSWTVFDDLPCFEKLVLENCKILEEMPDCLESSSTIVEIELYNCSNVESMVRDIREQQNDIVKVHNELQENQSRGIFGG